MMSALAVSQYALLTKWASPRRRSLRLAAAAQPQPEAVQTWEDEGGGLPLTGAQLSPDIPVRPQSTLGQDG
ncbi:hypothetical protein DEH84_03715 [Aquabacterium olei]|uniref:Uncharacterized protein n=2 Tax=Aquabacterium olei TaxID=1296669 RepID=A0A2U8FNK4_9BURK|nr:hypothetical protein DEH84_03715 [Aquabacterium olei]